MLWCSRTGVETSFEANRREHAGEPRQAFYAGLKKPRELTHDAQVYRAYRDLEAQIRDQGGRVQRVILDYELKREYQHFLQERHRLRADSTGRPDRTPEEIAAWAKDHDLPYDRHRVRFPDARIEFEDRDRQERHRDIEVVTPQLSRRPRGGRRQLRIPDLRWRAVAINERTAWRTRTSSTTGRGAAGVNA